MKELGIIVIVFVVWLMFKWKENLQEVKKQMKKI